MAPRSKSGTQARQKVRLRRQIGVFDGKNVANLARQTKEAFDSLLAALNGDAGALEALGIVDGNAVPKLRLPERPELEFAGDGVVMTTTSGRYVATIAGANGLDSATGLDGVDLSLAAGALIGRASREVENISIGIVNQNDYPASTADWKRVTASGVVRGWTGFEAPDPVTGTQAFWFTNISASTGISFTNDSGSSSAGNRILTPTGSAFLVRPGDSVLFWYDYDSDYWRIFTRDWTLDIPAAGVSSVTAVDGIQSSGGLSPVIRRRWATVVLSTSGVFNDWVPDALWDTTEVLLFNPTGFTQVNGFDSPAGANDSLERIVWNTSTSTSFDISHDSGSNSSVTSRVLCPDNQAYTVRPRSGFRMLWDTTNSRWRIQGPSRSHSTLQDLTTGDPHTQYILVAGTRAFTGSQSMGSNRLTTVGGIDMVSVGDIDMNGGYIGRLLYTDWDSTPGGVGTTGTANYDRMGMDFGIPFVVPGRGGHLDGMPIVAQSGSSDGATDIDVAVSLSDIRGVDLRGGAFSVECKAYACDNVDPGAGKEGHVIRCEYLFTRDDNTNTWNRATLYELEAGRGLASLLIQPLMTSDTVLTVSINLGALDSGDRYYAVAKISGRGREA